MEYGYFVSYGTESVPLRDICSEEFLVEYPNILERFGWDDLDAELQSVVWEKFLKCQTDQGHTTHIFGDLRNTFASSQGIQDNDDLDQLIRIATHLATQALFLAFCHPLPRKPSYYPYGSDADNRVILGLLSVSGYSYWEFREQSVQRISPECPRFAADTIASSGNGGVVCSAPLVGRDITHPRTLAAVHFFAGPLKTPSLEEELNRITDETLSNGGLEALSNATHTGPSLKLNATAQGSLDEQMARDESGAEIVHLWSTNPVLAWPNMQVQSYIRLAKGEMVRTSWMWSMDAVIFATHVSHVPLQALHHKSRNEHWELGRAVSDQPEPLVVQGSLFSFREQEIYRNDLDQRATKVVCGRVDQVGSIAQRRTSSHLQFLHQTQPGPAFRVHCKGYGGP
jgi:hypothetical protein